MVPLHLSHVLIQTRLAPVSSQDHASEVPLKLGTKDLLLRAGIGPLVPFSGLRVSFTCRHATAGGIQLLVEINGQTSDTLWIPAFVGRTTNHASSGKLTHYPFPG